MGDATGAVTPTNITTSIEAQVNGSGSRPGQSLTAFSLDESTIDDVRPLRVAVIGAGLSGVLAGVLLPAKVPNIQLTIFEKNNEVVSLLIQNGRIGLWLKTRVGRYVVGEHLSRGSV